MRFTVICRISLTGDVRRAIAANTLISEAQSYVYSKSSPNIRNCVVYLRQVQLRLNITSNYDVSYFANMHDLEDILYALQYLGDKLAIYGAV